MTGTSVSEGHVHSDECNSRNCFREKMRYMRENGGMKVQYPNYGEGIDPMKTTIKTEQDKIVERARRNGWEARPKHKHYDKTAGDSLERKEQY